MIGSLLGDREVPLSAKIALGAVALYLASPVDLIPDFIPFVGYLDDLLLAAVVVDGLLNYVDRSLLLKYWPGGARVARHGRRGGASAGRLGAGADQGADLRRPPTHGLSTQGAWAPGNIDTRALLASSQCNVYTPRLHSGGRVSGDNVCAGSRISPDGIGTLRPRGSL